MMIRILFLVLWIIPVLGPQADGAIEIYVHGHKFDSIQAYLESKKNIVEQSPAKLASLNSQQEEDVRQEAQHLGINVDFSKVKTFQVDQHKISGKTMHQLYVLSVEDGVIGALQDFYQGQSDFPVFRRISSGQLQKAIQQAVTTSKDPKLLISMPGKLRIMSLAPNRVSK